MINESLTYLQESEDWIKTTLVGGVLVFLSFLLVPMVFVYGYLTRVLRNAMHGDDAVPVFDDWGEMGVDGLKAAVIALVYGIIPGIVFSLVFFVGGGIGAISNSGAGQAASLLVILAGGLVALALGLVAAYVLPAALLNYAEKGTVGAGFAVGDLRPVVTNGTYFTGWLYAFAIGIGVGVAFFVLNLVPILGWLVSFVLGPFVSFYAGVAVAYIFGTTWAELNPVERHDETVRDEQVAI